MITAVAANDQVPTWLRDGKRLMFYSDRTGKVRIYAMKPDGTDVKKRQNERYKDQVCWCT